MAWHVEQYLGAVSWLFWYCSTPLMVQQTPALYVLNSPAPLPPRGPEFPVGPRQLWALWDLRLLGGPAEGEEREMKERGAVRALPHTLPGQRG